MHYVSHTQQRLLALNASDYTCLDVQLIKDSKISISVNALACKRAKGVAGT
jgi:hypothetical protein